MKKGFNYLISLDRCRILFCQNRHFIDFNEFQWIFMNDFWSKIIKIDPKWLRVTVSRSIHQICSNRMYIKNCPIFLKCGKIRIMLLMNEFEFGPYLVHLWSVLGASDLYNKRYSFEQNHKMLNPNHLRNVQPHLFVEISKNPKFSISTWTIQNKPKTCIYG